MATASSMVCAQSYQELQQAEKATDVEEKVGQKLALDARFLNLDGNYYSLKEFFYNDRPVFLSINYAGCPQLCQLQLRRLADRFSDSDLEPGKDFEFISVSLDPREAQDKTRQVKATFSQLMTGSREHKGIHFLVGKRKDIDSVADSIGFKYVYLPGPNHYSHAPLCVAVTPSGKISRYIHNLDFESKDLEESAAIALGEEVSEESVSSFLYGCLKWFSPGRYTKDLLGLMKIAGAATVVIVGACVIPFWFKSPKAIEPSSEQVDSDLESSDGTQQSVDQ